MSFRHATRSVPSPERAFHLYVGSFLERSGEVCELLPPDNSAMPFRVGLPLAVWASRKWRTVTRDQQPPQMELNRFTTPT